MLNKKDLILRENLAKDMILRDHLAVDRTKLANQRTLLAYIRTFIMFIASGFSLIKIFPNDTFLIILGILLLICSAIIIAIGVINYLIQNHILKKAYSKNK